MKVYNWYSFVRDRSVGAWIKQWLHFVGQSISVLLYISHDTEVLFVKCYEEV